jgi:hypothetical protein
MRASAQCCDCADVLAATCADVAWREAAAQRVSCQYAQDTLLLVPRAPHSHDSLPSCGSATAGLTAGHETHVARHGLERCCCAPPHAARPGQLIHSVTGRYIYVWRRLHQIAQGAEASELWGDASSAGHSAVGPAGDAQYCIMALSGFMVNQRHWGIFEQVCTVTPSKPQAVVARERLEAVSHGLASTAPSLCFPLQLQQAQHSALALRLLERYLGSSQALRTHCKAQRTHLVGPCCGTAATCEVAFNFLWHKPSTATFAFL